MVTKLKIERLNYTAFLSPFIIEELNHLGRAIKYCFDSFNITGFLGSPVK